MYKYLIHYKINTSKDLMNDSFEEFNTFVESYCKISGEVIKDFIERCRIKHKTDFKPIIINIISVE